MRSIVTNTMPSKLHEGFSHCIVILISIDFNEINKKYYYVEGYI